MCHVIVAAWINIAGASQEKAAQQERAKQLQEQLLAAKDAAVLAVEKKAQTMINVHLQGDEQLTPTDALFKAQANIQYEALKVNVPTFENEAFDALLKEDLEASGAK